MEKTILSILVLITSPACGDFSGDRFNAFETRSESTAVKVESATRVAASQAKSKEAAKATVSKRFSSAKTGLPTTARIESAGLETGDNAAASETMPSETMLNEYRGLGVKRAVLTSGVSEREPDDMITTLSLSPVVGSKYALTNKVMAFFEMRNDGDVERKVRLRISRGNVTRFGATLSVPSHARRWRTWGTVPRVKDAGVWKLDLIDVSSETVGEAEIVLSSLTYCVTGKNNPTCAE